MKNSRLLDILRQLNTRERSKFKDYVFSPFFNKNKKVQKLYIFVLKHAPSFQHLDLNKPLAFEHLFGNIKYKDLQINNIISDLLQLLYDFLAHKQYQSNPQSQKKFLLAELLKRDLTNHVEPAARRFEQLQNKTVFRNAHFHLNQYNYFDKLDQYYTYKMNKTRTEYIQNKSDHLDLFYMSNKLQIACNMESNQSVINVNYDCYFLEEVIEHYQKHLDIYKHYPAIGIYFQTLQMLKNEKNEEHYHRLKKDLQIHIALFSQKDLWTLHHHILNYCIRKINSGQIHYYEQVLELYKIMLKEEVIFNDGYLSQWSYKNIVTVGLRTKRFEWTKKFIETYKENLTPEEKENALAFNLSAYYYETKAYKKALQTLHHVEFTDTTYHLGAKIIQLKSYYELDEAEALFSLIEAFQKFILRNKKLSHNKKKANSNMLKIVKRIFQLKNNNNKITKSLYKSKRKVIEQKLLNTEPISNKDWLGEIFQKL